MKRTCYIELPIREYRAGAEIRIGKEAASSKKLASMHSAYQRYVWHSMESDLSNDLRTW